MLALSRREGQTIYIDGDIEITITSIRGNRVTLGIEAPRDKHIQRGELREQTESPAKSPKRLSKTVAMPLMETLGEGLPCCG